MRSSYGVLDAEIIFAQKRTTYQKASLFKRFLNWSIDSMTILNLSIFVEISMGIFFVLMGKQAWVDLLSMDAINFILGWILIFPYYFFCEYYLGGKTLGKFSTKTKVRTISGEAILAKDIFYRSALRLIPFEPLSIFFGKKCGWHDRYSRTMVVEDL
ncbi:MAG: RDD family protein [Bacteroidota bacterium]